ncbi:MAG: hypothetical protein HYT94_02230 [Parcubacteria group bacterium]|nr:hypothetical protein [Parcubacteria group bacterium]
MILFEVEFFDNGPGALARVIEVLSTAGVNLERPNFRAYKEGVLVSRRVGRGTFVVRDEERDITRSKILALEKDPPKGEKRQKLGLKLLGVYYDVTIKLEHKPGALAAELVQLAKLGVSVCHTQASYKNEKNEVLVNLILKCSPKQYHLAKQALGGKKLLDESPFSANAVIDIDP